jgi:hypothetical protein
VVVKRVMVMPALRWWLTTRRPAGLGTVVGTPVGHFPGAAAVGHDLPSDAAWAGRDDARDPAEHALTVNTIVSAMTHVVRLIMVQGNRST